jgi:hypothetical protein
MGLAGEFGTKTWVSRLTAWNRAVVMLLEDGQWHDQEEIIAAAMSTVPPGVALRTTEAARRNSNRDAPKARVKKKTHSVLVASGQRSKVIEGINSMMNGGRIERVEDSGGSKRLRLITKVPTVLIVRDRGEMTVSASSDVVLVEVDSEKLGNMTLDELKDLRQKVEILPTRLIGRYHAKNMLNVAILMKERDA